MIAHFSYRFIFLKWLELGRCSVKCTFLEYTPERSSGVHSQTKNEIISLGLNALLSTCWGSQG